MRATIEFTPPPASWLCETGRVIPLTPLCVASKELGLEPDVIRELIESTLEYRIRLIEVPVFDTKVLTPYVPTKLVEELK